MWLCILFFCAASAISAQTNSTDSTRTDTTTQDPSRVRMIQYLGAVSSMSTDQRTIGIPSEFARQYGNAPLVGFGLNILWIGDLLFKTNQLRSSFTLEKLLNVYPSPRILENFRGSFQIGYYVYEQPNFKAYPFLGFGSSIFYVENGVRLNISSAEGGIGADYFIPKTPLMLGLQAAYSHGFNIRAPQDVANNQSGFTARAHVSIFIREKFNYWGWD
jgi:hypothetical protein